MVAELEPLLVDSKEAARIIGVDRSTLYKFHNNGRLGPVPVKLGRRCLWSVAEIRLWVDMGCPVRQRWVEMKERQ